MNQIKGYGDKYLVSEEGEFWSNLTKKYLAPQINRHGYKTVYLWNSGKGKTHKVHRLVCETFVPNPDDLPQVNHIDGNKLNNHYSNLEWVTNQQNCEHHHAKKYEVVDPTGQRHVLFNQNKFCREYGLNQGNFNYMLQGKFKQSMGWRLA